ncbi:MAG TPA: phosphatidate cytidylyltransferase [Candidatus Acidoferrum sp.]|nr:phosphatidate cytidylyltransferase [Candidatus Acidoferrum sp.]
MKLEYLMTLAITEVVIVGGFVIPLLLGRGGVLTLAFCLGLACTYEMAKLRFAISYQRLVTLVPAALLLLALTTLPVLVQLILALAGMALLALPPSKSSIAALVLYPVVFVSFMPALFDLRQGSAFIAFTYLVTESCDSFALLIGKAIGRHKPFKVSPNKTLEGVVGGIAVATLLGTGAGHLLQWSWSFSAGFSLLLACTTVPGDLAASRIKRACGVKDFGHVLPLQGGVLDIYDSTLFNLPIAFVVLWLSQGLS